MLVQPVSGDPAVNYTEAEFRNLITSLLAAANGGSVAEGVTAAWDLAVTQRAAGANFSVDIAAGKAFAADDDVSGGGTYWCWSDAVYNLTTPSAPAS